MNPILGVIKQVPESQFTIIEPNRDNLFRYLLVVLQLAVLSWLVVRYEVEPDLGLSRLIVYVSAGFLIHSLLPFTYRLSFLILLSVGVVFWLMNWVPALVLLGLFLVFFGILQLPISTLYRFILLLIAGAGLGYVRYKNPGWLPNGYQVIPIIGSIFMFRSFIYLHDVRFEKKPLPLKQQLVYFLMLPNFVLTLFPLVDFKVFGKNYYNSEPLGLYQKGVRWMVRGFFHLMLFRLIYYFLRPAPGEIVDLHSFALFALTSYLLIVRLSGLFHIAVGVMALFGYDLPRVFHNYFFASGFSDLWRRINVYWRDFVMKIFYYPIYFKFRKIGKVSGMVLTILVIFWITWLLHSYQWFWLKGTFPITAVDGIFWSIFGVLIAASSVYQQKVPKKKRLAGRLGNVGRNILRSFNVVSMLAFMSVLWSFWESPSISRWLETLKTLKSPTNLEIGQLSMVVLGIGILLFVGFYLFNNTRISKFLEPSDKGLLSAFWGSLTLLLFGLLCIPSVIQIFQPLTDKPVEHYYQALLTSQDDGQMIQGYYEDILMSSNLTDPLANMQQRPDDWVALAETPAGYETKDWRKHELLPNVQTTLKDQKLSTNQWAMRDKDYSKVKPENALRFAIMGGSYVFGSGVADEEIFDVILEDNLNESTELGISYEMMNFSLPGNHIIHHTYRLENKVLEFQPDVAIFISHGVDFERVYQTIAAVNIFESEYPLPFLDTLLEKYHMEPGVDPNLKLSAQAQMGLEVISSTLEYLGDICEENGIIPVVVHWPRTNRPVIEETVNSYFDLARANGFQIIDLAGFNEGYTALELMLARFDGHPNALGHRLIADRLQEIFETDPYWIEIARDIQESHIVE